MLVSRKAPTSETSENSKNSDKSDTSSDSAISTQAHLQMQYFCKHFRLNRYRFSNSPCPSVSAIVLFICLVSAVPMSLICTLSAVANETNEPGWLLQGNSKSGHKILEVNQKNVKIIFPDDGYEALVSAPSWDILWYNSKTHQQYPETYAHYRQRLMLPTTPQRAPKVDHIETTYAGMRGFKVSIPAAAFNQRAALPEFDMRHESTSRRVKQLHFYFSNPVDLPSGALEFLCTHFGTPNFGAIPLACYRELNSGELITEFDTKSSARKVLPPKDFIRPRGYANVQAVSLLPSGSSAANIQDFMNDMKVGEDFGAKKK